MLGVSWAYLSEKYQTLALGILNHGINNALAVASAGYPTEYTGFFFIALIINQIAVYTIAKTNIDVYVLSGVRQAAEFGAAIPQRARNYFIPQQVHEPILV